MVDYNNFDKETLIKFFKEEREVADNARMQLEELSLKYMELQVEHGKLREAQYYTDSTLAIHEDVMPKLELVAKLASKYLTDTKNLTDTKSGERWVWVGEDLDEAIEDLRKHWRFDMQICEVCGAVMSDRGTCTDPHCGKEDYWGE